MKDKETGVVASLDAARKRRAAESIVVCLDCGAAYEKPGSSRTLAANPGCPACGYMGWIGVAASQRGVRPALYTETRASSSSDV